MSQEAELTLLERARAVQARRPMKAKITEDEIDLAIAFLNEVFAHFEEGYGRRENRDQETE